MDIDTPGPPVPGETDLSYTFSLVYPLPFRILTLISLGTLAWASNVHGVTLMGIDAGKTLDVRLDDLDTPLAGLGADVLPRAANSGAERGPAAEGTVTGVRKSGGTSEYLHPSRIYPPAYHLSLVLSLWTLSGWSIFHFATQGDPESVSRWTLFPFLWAFVALVFLISPWTSFLRRERIMAMRSFRRITLEGLTAPVPFCDVLMADVMTSFAKVMGDCWVSACLAFAAEQGLAAQVADLGCYKEVMVPFMTSLPYIFRLRQCLAEYYGRHTPTPRRSLLNALKYASAFPVIILSALQGAYGDPYAETLSETAEDSILPAYARGFSAQHVMFQVWVLAVFVNSLYSFWWDVTNDWGMNLLTPSTWNATRAPRSRRVGPIRLPSPAPPSRQNSGSSSSATGATNTRSSPPHGPDGSAAPAAAGRGAVTGSSRWTSDTMHRSRSASVQVPMALTPEIGTPSFEEPIFPPAGGPSLNRTSQSRHSNHLHHHHTRSFYLPHAHTRRHSVVNLGSLTQDSPYLRPTLLLPDPLLYWLAISVDLLLRFTWSLKLSSHLHEIHEIESGVFAMEALEVARRWMWTFLRIEWEAVRKSGDVNVATGDGAEAPLLSDASADLDRNGLGGSSFLGVTGVLDDGLTKSLRESEYETDESLVMVDRAGLGLSGIRDKGNV